MESNATKEKREEDGRQLLSVFLLAIVFFFVAGKWATSTETYSGMTETLKGLQKKAIELSGTATALASGIAAIPGDSTTPIANKVADVAGYMVIVYAVIIIEKYLLTLTGFVAFKILLPIGCILWAAGCFLGNDWKEYVHRIAIRGRCCIII